MAKSIKPRRYFTLVLHSHLPYVLGYGGWPHGTDWLYEATCETYVPLLQTLTSLTDEGIKPALTIGISPILAEQLRDRAFPAGLAEYVEIKVKSATDDAASFRRQGLNAMAALAEGWRRFYLRVWDDFVHRYQSDVVGAFAAFQEMGAVEIITCAATHAYLPLVGREETINLQLRVALANYREHFGRAPRGVWLPECAYRPGYDWRYPLEPWANAGTRYRPGLEEMLSKAGLGYFFVDTHLLVGGRALGVYAARFEALRRIYEQMLQSAELPPRGEKLTPHKPYYVGAADPAVACFVRDADTGLTVWSGEWGYPGDGWYLDFHKKHFPGGLRYWRVTSAKAGLGEKEPYRPEQVPARIAENADHFTALVRKLLAAEEEPAIVVSPYDAELFGHWWFEGPRWLGEVIRRLAAADDVQLITAGDYLERHPPTTVIALPEGSWGEGGFHGIWLNQDTAWSWKLIYEVEESLAGDAARCHSGSPPGDLFAEALREFLLLIASDWQFLITTWSARDYAEARLKGHYDATRRLIDAARRLQRGEPLTTSDAELIKEIKERPRPFRKLNPEWFSAG